MLTKDVNSVIVNEKVKTNHQVSYKNFLILWFLPITHDFWRDGEQCVLDILGLYFGKILSKLWEPFSRNIVFLSYDKYLKFLSIGKILILFQRYSQSMSIYQIWFKSIYWLGPIRKYRPT